MNIEQQALEIAAEIRDSWGGLEFTSHGSKWSLRGPGGSVLDNISFSRYMVSEPDKYPALAAVDGSSVVILDAGSFLIGAVRVATVLYNSPFEPADAVVSDTDIIFLSQKNHKKTYKREYLRAYGVEPPSVPDSFGDIIQRIRSMREMRAAVELMSSLKRGDIMLMDGALKADIDTPDEFYKKLEQRVADSEITLLGISKKSSLSLGHLPLAAVLKKKGMELFPDEEWFCPLYESIRPDHQLGGIYLARMEGLSDYVFRVDAYPEDTPSVDPTVFSLLSLYSKDPTYLGYPFPLAHVHNASIIRRSDAEALAYRIEESAVSGGIKPADWAGMFMNFHDVLDRGL